MRTLSFDDSNCNRQFKAPWARAAGIEQENSVDHFVVRPVAVTEYDDVDRLLQQLGPEDVREKESPAGDGQPGNFVTITIIIIPANERHRRDRAQCVEHVIAADVAGVQDRIHSRQCLQRLRANQTVGVGDDADTWLRDRAVPRFRGASTPRPRDRVTSQPLIPRRRLSSPRSSSGSGP